MVISCDVMEGRIPFAFIDLDLCKVFLPGRFIQTNQIKGIRDQLGFNFEI